MSRLDDLIAELCPDGVPVVSIGSLIRRQRQRGKDDPSVTQVYAVSNTMGIVRAEDMRDNTVHSEDTSNYTILRQGMVAYDPSRLNIGSIARLKEETPGLVSPMYVVFSIDDRKVTQEYFDYLIESTYVSNKIDSLKEEGARFRFDFERWNWIEIELPPLSVQDEIVKTLNVYSSLIAELRNELKLREKQYEYYLDTILYTNVGNKWCAINMCCESITDGDHQPPPKADAGIPFITISNISNNRIDFSDTKHVPVSYYNALQDKRRARIGDLLYSIVGSFGIPVYIDFDKQFVFQRHIAIIRPNDSKLLSKYLYYCMKSMRFYRQADSVATGAAQRTVGLSALGKLQIPLYSLDEQKHIVSILDRFDSLCNDASTGLPAEIAARQKQYEYYRDKLLTFRNLA